MTLNEWRQQAEYFDFGGHQIASWRAGDWSDAQRPVLLLIHGFPTASWDWQEQWEPLSRRFRLLALDMLGFGFSAKPRGHQYSIMEQADIWQQRATQLGVQDCHLLAHDYGDTVAQELLARSQQDAAGALRIRSACLLNGGLFPETHRATRMQKLLNGPLGPVLARLMSEGSFRRSFAGVFGAQSQPSDAELKDFWALLAAGEGTPGVVHRLIRYIDERRRWRARWVGALTDSPVPLRVICGADDPVSGAHMAERYRELVPRPDVVLLPGIGHYPQCEAPGPVLDAIQDFHSRVLHEPI